MPLKTFEQEVRIHEFQRDQVVQRTDLVTVEEPMEIRVVHGPESKRSLRSVSVTMRTPGNDDELALGFLFTEGFLTSAEQIDSVEFRGVTEDGTPTGNIVRVNVRPDVELDFSGLQRNFFTHSSCGVCGKASLETLEVKGVRALERRGQKLNPEIVFELPDRLRAGQPAFANTGGIHASGIASLDGMLEAIREDVGRHNAVDKSLGHLFMTRRLPAEDRLLVVSGRASFELTQKAIVAGIAGLIAVGAPSSLAVEMARRYHLLLVGFTSLHRFNVYADENGLLT